MVLIGVHFKIYNSYTGQLAVGFKLAAVDLDNGFMSGKFDL